MRSGKIDTNPYELKSTSPCETCAAQSAFLINHITARGPDDKISERDNPKSLCRFLRNRCLEEMSEPLISSFV